MKSILQLALVAALFFAACNKNDSPAATPTPPEDSTASADSNKLRYTISGLTDLSMRKRDSLIVPLGITHTGGEQEKIELSIVNLPDNVTGTFQPAAGMPSFATSLVLKSLKATAGDYNIKIVIKSASGSTKSFETKLTINSEANDECVKAMAGSYEYDGCNETEITTIEVSSPNEIFIARIPKGYAIDVLVDCNNMSLSIPETDVQLPPGTTISGFGTILSDDEFTLTYKLSGYYIKDTTACTVRYKRR